MLTSVHLTAFMRTLDALEAVQVEIGTISTRVDDARRHDLVRLRRKLAQALADISRVAEPIFDASGDAEMIAQFRNIFSAMRSAAALHQANWPAVRLDEANDEFRRSASGVREANRAFVSWMRAASQRLVVSQ